MESRLDNRFLADLQSNPTSSSQNYIENGYYISKSGIKNKSIATLLSNFCLMASQLTGVSYDSAYDEKLCETLSRDRALQTYLYDKIRLTPYLNEFIYQCGILDVVRKIHPHIYLLEKIIFRIDQPLETSELATWHQDNFYVQGSEDIITAWIPLQRVTYFNGCLSIMPKTHLLGKIPHDFNVLVKKYSPTNIYDKEIRYIELDVGDCLLFHSLLLHSGNLNISKHTRFTVQARFLPIKKPQPAGKPILIK